MSGDWVVLASAMGELLSEKMLPERGRDTTYELTTDSGSQNDDDGAGREEGYVIDRWVDHLNDNRE